MDIIATITHNHPEMEERVGLGITHREHEGWAICTDTGEDAGLERWETAQAARAAIAHLWAADTWDLQWA